MKEDNKKSKCREDLERLKAEAIKNINTEDGYLFFRLIELAESFKSDKYRESVVNNLVNSYENDKKRRNDNFRFNQENKWNIGKSLLDFFLIEMNPHAPKSETDEFGLKY